MRVLRAISRSVLLAARSSNVPALSVSVCWSYAGPSAHIARLISPEALLLCKICLVFPLCNLQAACLWGDPSLAIAIDILLTLVLRERGLRTIGSMIQNSLVKWPV